MPSRALPRGLSFFHPICLISTFLGIGLIPFAPGTWASVAALPISWYIVTNFGVVGLVVAGIALFFLGWGPASVYERRTNETDPSAIVIDEVAGQMLALSAVPTGLGWYVGGFLLFRLTDILKPWPVSWVDRKVPGGFGIMFDDVLAAVYSWIILYGVVILLR